MKKRSVLAWIAIPLFIFYGCSKSNGGSAAITGTATQWTLKGITYKGLETNYNDTTTGLGIFVSADAAGNFISIIFYSHPAANGDYTVTNGGIPAAGAYCQIQVYTYTGTAGTIYTSTGKSGDIVKVSISGGKITASFTDVTVAIGSVTATVSGTVVQK